MTVVTRPSIEEATQTLVDYHVENEPAILAIYRFPSDEQIRLVELDESMKFSEAITPFYFSADPEFGVPYEYGIALIRPEQKPLLSPPEHWGDWSQAIEVYHR